MPDTPENRREYPLTYNQVPGTNFALARIGAIISLSCGAILDLGICRYAGKGQGEVSLLRRLWDVLRPGDVLLGDRLMWGWAGMLLAKAAGRRYRQPPVGAPHGRLPQGDSPGQGRPPGRVEEADIDPLGGPSDLQRAARFDHGPRGAVPGGAAGVPDPVGRVGDDAAGPRRGEPGGAGVALSGPVEQRGLPSRLRLKIHLVSIPGDGP